MITDIPSSNSLAASVSSTARYGQTATGTTGLVDIGDLVSRIKEKFPKSASLIDKIYVSLNSAVVYNTKGEAKPDANGLSIYMPTQLVDFSDSIIYTMENWQTLVNKQYHLLSNGTGYGPKNTTTFFDSHVIGGDTIRGITDLENVFNATLEILKIDTKDNDIDYYTEELDPSLIMNRDGNFSYTWNRKIMSFCNDKYCIPASMDLQFSAAKKFALYPANLESNRVNGSVSLVYEIDENKGSTIFLGAVPEIDKEETISKERWALFPGDKISTSHKSTPNSFGKIWNAVARNNTNSILTIQPYEQIQVTEKFEPHYVQYNGSYIINLVFCDYSNNCESSRYSTIEESALKEGISPYSKYRI